MNLQQFVDTVAMPCCVLSVHCTPEHTCGEIRILCSNQPYKAAMGPGYYDGMPYHELVPQDNKFEDYCFRAAILGQRMHAYVETRALHAWTDQTLIPLRAPEPDADGDSGRTGYCQFIFEFTQLAEPDRMATVSVSAAETVIRACIELMGKGSFHDSLGKCLDAIMDYSEAKGCRIMLADHEQEMAVLLCERTAAGAWPTRTADAAEDVITYSLLCSWEKMIGVSNCILVQNAQDMELLAKSNPVWAESMHTHGVTSLVLIPLQRNQTVLGYLYVLNFNTEKTVEVKELVELMSFFLGSEIANYLLMHKLDTMSRADALTGLKNRRAMEERLRGITPGMPFGVINLDLNGLKVVNDTQGHDAGDRLLVKAAEALSKMFYQDDIFRTGGDEFIVLSPGITRDSFERKLQRLRDSMSKSAELSFALGSFWSGGDVGLQAAFRTADERMYADKRAYYLKNPERKKR